MYLILVNPTSGLCQAVLEEIQNLSEIDSKTLVAIHQLQRLQETSGMTRFQMKKKTYNILVGPSNQKSLNHAKHQKVDNKRGDKKWQVTSRWRCQPAEQHTGAIVRGSLRLNANIKYEYVSKYWHSWTLKFFRLLSWIRRWSLYERVVPLGYSSCVWDYT